MAKKKEAALEQDAVPMTEELSLVVAPSNPLVFKGNFEEIKKTLKADLAKYKKVIITDENLEKYKLVARSIVSTRTMLTARKKEAVDMYIKLPENTLKAMFDELLAVVDEVETHLKGQFEQFDIERHNELEVVFKEYIALFQADYNISETNLAKVELKKQYFNKTAKESETKEDIEEQFKAFVVQEKTYADNVKLVETMCAGEERLNPKLFVAQLEYRAVAAIVNDIVSEKERFINQAAEVKNDFVETPVVAATVTKTTKKEAMLSLSIKIDYPESKRSVLTAFFAANPEIKVTKLV